MHISKVLPVCVCGVCGLSTQSGVYTTCISHVIKIEVLTACSNHTQVEPQPRAFRYLQTFSTKKVQY